MDEAAAALFEELARHERLQARTDDLLAGIGALHRLESAVQDATIAALRRRAEAAEAERDALGARLAALSPPAPASPHASRSTGSAAGWGARS